MAHRFSLFPSDVDGLIGALELTTDSKQREELLKKASVAATRQVRLQRYLLKELSATRDALDQFYEFFDQIVGSLANKPMRQSSDPIELALEVEDTTRDLRYCLYRLKEAHPKTGYEKAKRLEESLRQKGWLLEQ